MKADKLYRKVYFSRPGKIRSVAGRIPVTPPGPDTPSRLLSGLPPGFNACPVPLNDRKATDSRLAIQGPGRSWSPSGPKNFTFWPAFE